MVVGGYESNGTVELIDLSGNNLNCPPITNDKFDYNSVGTYFNNRALLCGGFNESTDTRVTRQCRSYNVEVSQNVVYNNEIIVSNIAGPVYHTVQYY